MEDNKYYEINEKAISILQLLDSMTYNHCVRTKQIAQEVETKFGLHTNLLSQAAILHDIGKIYVSTKILDKPDKLSKLERQIVDLHPYMGYMILQELNEQTKKDKKHREKDMISDDVCNLVLFHHGIFPPMLEPLEIEKTEETRKYALMLHTIDAFEALTTDRAYRRGYTQRKAVEIMDKEPSHDKNVLDFLHAHKFYSEGI